MEKRLRRVEKKVEMSGEPWKGVGSGGKWESDGCEQWKKWEWWRMVGRVERWEIAGMGEQWKEWRMVERVENGGWWVGDGVEDG